MNIRETEVGKTYYIDDSFFPITKQFLYEGYKITICAKEEDRFCYKLTPDSHLGFWQEYRNFPYNCFLTLEETLVSYYNKCKQNIRKCNKKETKENLSTHLKEVEASLNKLREDTKKLEVAS